MASEATSQRNEAELFLTLIDLMTEIWDAFSATQNIRMLIAAISSYMAKQGTVESKKRVVCRRGVR